MGAIARRHAAKTAEQGQARRKKRLAIAAELIEYLGAEAHRVNTKSNGKEGGRIVRKLFSDLVDAALERAIAADVAGYQRAALLSVEPAEGWNAEARPEIRVRFAVEGEVS